jgi:hypothetical protein
VFLGSGLLFLAMLFASSATAAGLVAISGATGDARTTTALFGQALLLCAGQDLRRAGWLRCS